MLVKCFLGTGLDADDTKRRFYRVVDLIKMCRSSYMIETVIVDSIKEVEIDKRQYEKLFDCINDEINKWKPERKIKATGK
jgi:acetolactate synthase regulatory subunit